LWSNLPPHARFRVETHAARAEISTNYQRLNVKLLRSWHFLQSVKSVPPNARLLLWQLAQLCAPAGAKCIAATGAVTWRPWADPARME
jgi:hypothetical protein